MNNLSRLSGYVWPSDRVGPLAVASRVGLADVFTTCLGLAANQGTEDVFTIISGANEQAVAVGLARIVRRDRALAHVAGRRGR